MVKKSMILLGLILFSLLLVACSQEAVPEEADTNDDTTITEIEAEVVETTNETAVEIASEVEANVVEEVTHETSVALLNQMPLVQHHHNPETNTNSFTCIGNEGLGSVKTNPEGSIFVGPDSGDIALRGINVVFEITPAGDIQAAPMGHDAKLINQAGEETFRVPLDEVLVAFTSGDAVWTGSFDDIGRGNCAATFQG